VLRILSRFGAHAFEGLPVLAFAVPPEKRNVQTAFYSYRMLMNFGPRRQYLADLTAAPGPVALLAGSKDEIFYANRYAALLKPARPDLDITVVPGLGHTDMTLKPAGIDAIAAKVF
jgi:pimeloyl-ACP methyl ester carboxylesterase